MIIKQKNLYKTLLPILSVAILLLSIPQQVDARRNVNRNTNVNRNVNRNTNVNVNRNTNVNVNVNNHHGCCRHGYYHPVATAAAVTAAVVVTSAIVGSIVHALPTGCVNVMRGGIAYQQCGSVWYQPQYSGNNVNYIVVQQPY